MWEGTSEEERVGRRVCWDGDETMRLGGWVLVGGCEQGGNERLRKKGCGWKGVGEGKCCGRIGWCEKGYLCGRVWVPR